MRQVSRDEHRVSVRKKSASDFPIMAITASVLPETSRYMTPHLKALGMIADARPRPTAAQAGENHSNGGAIWVRLPKFGGYLGNVG
jgi:hypothetical protein